MKKVKVCRAVLSRQAPDCSMETLAVIIVNAFLQGGDCMESKIFKGSPNRRCNIHANGLFELSSNGMC